MKENNSYPKKKRLVYKTPTLQKMNIDQTQSGWDVKMNENRMHRPAS